MRKFLLILLAVFMLALPVKTFADSVVVGEGGSGWVTQADCSTVVALGSGCFDSDDFIFYVGNGVTAGAVGPGTAASVGFANVLGGTNTTEALIVGSGGSLSWGGTGIINASQYKGTSSPSATEFGYVAGLTSTAQTQLDAKAPLASPTFTGTVTIPSPWMLGATSVTATGAELNYSVGVTSAIQTQLDGKAATSHSQAESTLTFTDITTGNSSATKHGYLPKLSNVASQFLNGQGAWASGLVSSDSIWDAKGDLAAATGVDAAQKLTVGANDSMLVADSAQVTGLKWFTKGANNSIFGVNDSGVLGYYTTLYLDVPWAAGTAAPPTAEGQAYWNTSTDVLTVGTGASYVNVLTSGGALPVSGGGTGKTVWTQYAIPYLSATDTFSEVPIGTAGQYLKVNVGATGYEWSTVAGGGDVMGPATHAASYIPKWNGVPNSKTLVEGVAAPTSAIAGISDTQTLTNKSVDAEGTGNVVTIPVKISMPSAGCSNTTAGSFWDLPPAVGASVACVTQSGGAGLQKGVLDFKDGTTVYQAQTGFRLPSDFSVAGNLDATIKWYSPTTTGNVVWQIATVCVGVGEVDEPSAWNTASAVVDATQGTANQTNNADFTGIDTTGCAAGELIHIKVFRDPTHASDTMTGTDPAGTARFIGAEFTYRRAM